VGRREEEEVRVVVVVVVKVYLGEMEVLMGEDKFQPSALRG
jgi:hypothetical protein